MTFEKIYSSTKKSLYITKELRNKLNQILRCLFSFCNIFDQKKKKKISRELFAKCLLFHTIWSMFIFLVLCSLWETNEILHLFEFLFSVELYSYTSAKYCFDILNVDLYTLLL